MGGRGFFISTDGLIALFVMLVIFIAAAGYMGQASSTSVESLNLKRFSMDSISTLEKTGDLEDAVLQDKTTKVRQFLNKLPNSYCATINIYGSNDLNSAVMSVTKGGCKKASGETASITRSFIVRNGSDLNFFTAQMNMWHGVSA
ncbi:MAG: hypothetical protein ABID38_02570 [Candidatus Diapherotrites archaeon]